MRKEDLMEKTARELLQEKIKTRKAQVAVVGLGYVGLPLAMECVRKGFPVRGIEQNPERVEKIKRGEDYISAAGLPESGGSSSAKEASTAIKKIAATGEFCKVQEADVVLICVPTPLTPHREPDISYIVKVSKEVSRYLQPGTLVVLESTTYPGTTEEVVLPILQGSRLKVGEEFFLAFSPERIDPGNQRFRTANIPKVVGGVTRACTELARQFYSEIVGEVHPASSPRVAEMEKLLENIFRSVNIALVNELAILCRRMKIDIWEVLSLAKTKPFGFMPFYPGPGLGGHCIPIDPFYLTWKAREYDLATKFIELAGEINRNMPYYVVSLVQEALGTKKKSLNGASILVIGAAYKKDVEDTRDSPAVKVMEIIEELGGTVEYHDPYVPRIKGWEKKKSVSLEKMKEFDCVVIATDHACLDYEKIASDALLIVDTRDALRPRGISLPLGEKLFLL